MKAVAEEAVREAIVPELEQPAEKKADEVSPVVEPAVQAKSAEAEAKVDAPVEAPAAAPAPVAEAAAPAPAESAPEVKSVEPEVKSIEPEVKLPEPEVKSIEPEVKSAEPEAKPEEEKPAEVVAPVQPVEAEPAPAAKSPENAVEVKQESQNQIVPEVVATNAQEVPVDAAAQTKSAPVEVNEPAPVLKSLIAEESKPEAQPIAPEQPAEPVSEVKVEPSSLIASDANVQSVAEPAAVEIKDEVKSEEPAPALRAAVADPEPSKPEEVKDEKVAVVAEPEQSVPEVKVVPASLIASDANVQSVAEPAAVEIKEDVKSEESAPVPAPALRTAAADPEPSKPEAVQEEKQPIVAAVEVEKVVEASADAEKPSVRDAANLNTDEHKEDQPELKQAPPIISIFEPLLNIVRGNPTSTPAPAESPVPIIQEEPTSPAAATSAPAPAPAAASERPPGGIVQTLQNTFQTILRPITGNRGSTSSPNAEAPTEKPSSQRIGERPVPIVKEKTEIVNDKVDIVKS